MAGIAFNRFPPSSIVIVNCNFPAFHPAGGIAPRGGKVLQNIHCHHHHHSRAEEGAVMRLGENV